MADKKKKRRPSRRIFKQRLIASYRTLAVIFAAILLIAAAANIFHKDITYSEAENRQLTQKPELSWESIKSGRFMTDFESYIADQFFLRNQWISLKLFEDKLLGKKESNGVYLGRGGYLMEVLSTPDWENTKKNAEGISSFASRHSDIPVYISLVPNAAYILENKIPSGAPVRDQQEDIDQVLGMCGDDIINIDMVTTMKEHASEDIYYMTDHHWTSLGAYYGFQQLAAGMHISNPETEYNIYTVADDFQGTLASKSGYHGSEDIIQIYESKNKNPDYVVHYTEEGTKSASIYDSEKLNEKDKYTVFFGGNHARVEISTTVKEDKHLLLIKDSYANCMVQFLLPYYQDIIIIDPRYFYDNVDKLIENYGITDILFLYNVNTFLSDNSIADVLAPSDTDDNNN